MSYTCDICGLEREYDERPPAPIILPRNAGVRCGFDENAAYPLSNYGMACSEACIRAFKRGETRAPHPFVADDWYAEPPPDRTAEAIAYFERQATPLVTVGTLERQGLANLIESQRRYNDVRLHEQVHKDFIASLDRMPKARYRPWYVWAWRAFKRDVRRAWGQRPW